jgi:tRNA threonylcarbamoyladenosine biosynthesis protein TsaE
VTEIITINSLDELAAFATELSRSLPRGKLIGLAGELGAGKTTLVKEIVKALGCKESVTSPTYTVEHRYQLPDGGTIYHLDLYRLSDSEILNAIAEVMEDSRSLILVEWFEKFKEIEELAEVVIRLEMASESSRKITVQTHGDCSRMPKNG